MTADFERAQVYAAEVAAFDGTDLEDVVGFDTVARAITEVLDGDWWPGTAVAVRAMRADARSSNARCGDGQHTTISIAATQATIATGAHELAHALAGVDAGHGPRYRRAHLDVVSAITNRTRSTGRGDVHVEQLRHAYAAAGLTIGVRDWPAPPAPGSAIAL